jgi:hypothetical protein
MELSAMTPTLTRAKGCKKIKKKWFFLQRISFDVLLI